MRLGPLLRVVVFDGVVLARVSLIFVKVGRAEGRRGLRGHGHSMRQRDCYG